MNFKIFAIKTVSGILSCLKLNRISDKEVKNNLLTDYLALRKVIKSTEEDKREFVEKFQEDWKDELLAVRKLRLEKQPVEGYDEYLKAEAEGNLILQKMDETEVEVSINPVKIDKFVASVSEEEINFEQIAVLLDNGILEE